MDVDREWGVDTYQIRVKELPEDVRPREKLIRCGPDALSDGELLAVVLNTGIRGEGVLELSCRILRDYGSRGIVSERDVRRLRELLNIPEVKACQIIACLELGRRFFNGSAAGEAIKGPADAYRYVAEMGRLKKEEFKALYLDVRHRILHEEVVSVGSLTGSVVHPREVFRPAVHYGAAAVLVAHNHPSGDTAPSREDIAITRQLAEAGKLLGVEFLDHLIIGAGGYLSLKESGML